MTRLPIEQLALIAAPMVDQSDLAFRIWARKFGFTLAYTQMWLSEEIVTDVAYRSRVLRDLSPDLEEPLKRPVVVQLAGNDGKSLLEAARIVEPFCDGIDVNLGCRQKHALQGHFGGYLLNRKEWPLVESIVRTLRDGLSIPVHVKIRLCNPASDTPAFAVQLARAGASVIAIHARHVAIKRRRGGPAQLQWVTEVRNALRVAGLGSKTHVISNGNVVTELDCQRNLVATQADGLMIGEALLKNPSFLIADSDSGVYTPKTLALEYLDLCKLQYVPSVYTMRQHIKNFFNSCVSFSRSPSARAFFSKLDLCNSWIGLQDLIYNTEQK